MYFILVKESANKQKDSEMIMALTVDSGTK